MEAHTKPSTPGREYWLQATHERTAWIPHPRAASAKAADAMTALEDEIDCMTYALARLRARRNAILPISLLPESLENIFMFLRDEWPMRLGRPGRPGRPLRSNELGWLTITQVCAQWREVAIHHMPLWTKISLGLYEVGLDKIFLERAGCVALRDLNWRRWWYGAGDVPNPYTQGALDDFLRLVMNDTQLVRSLHIEDSISDMWWQEGDLEEWDDNGHFIHSFLLEFLSTFDRPASQLKSLTLLVRKTEQPQMLANESQIAPLNRSAYIISHYTPGLERIVLRGLPFPWTAPGTLPQLRALALLPFSGQAERHLTYTTKDLVRFLRSTPLLEELVLIRYIPVPLGEHDEEPIMLPCLRTLRLRGKLKSCLYLWRLLEVHPEAHTSVVLHSIEKNVDFAAIGACLSSHLRKTGLAYDTLVLHTVGSPRDDDNTPSTDDWTGWHKRTLALDLYDGTKQNRPRGSAYEKEAVYAAGKPFRHPGVHLNWFFSHRYHDFKEPFPEDNARSADEDEEAAGLYAPMPTSEPEVWFDPFGQKVPDPRPHDDLDKVAPGIMRCILRPGVDIARLRTLSLKMCDRRSYTIDDSDGLATYPWSAAVVRPILWRATRLETIRVVVNGSFEEEAVWCVTQAMKPISKVIPARALSVLSMAGVDFRPLTGIGAPQTESLVDALNRRAEEGYPIRELRLEICKTNDEALLTRLRGVVDSVECDTYSATRYDAWGEIHGRSRSMRPSSGEELEPVFEDVIAGQL